MQDAGMKYMIFTTKHHDGFCMFDSEYTDFSIAKGPSEISRADCSGQADAGQERELSYSGTGDS